MSADLSPGDGPSGKKGLWYRFCLLPSVMGLPGTLQAEKKKCSAMERYSLCYAKDNVKRRNTECRQGGDELSVREISFMHP